MPILHSPSFVRRILRLLGGTHKEVDATKFIEYDTLTSPDFEIDVEIEFDFAQDFLKCYNYF